MKKRCTEQQIIHALKQAELGETAAEICRKMGVAENQGGFTANSSSP